MTDSQEQREDLEIDVDILVFTVHRLKTEETDLMHTYRTDMFASHVSGRRSGEILVYDDICRGHLRV